MVENNYPSGYLDARTIFSQAFLKAFDRQVDNASSGCGTLVMMILCFPIGLCMACYNESCQLALYDDLVELSQNSYRRSRVDKPMCIKALNQDVLEFHDLVVCHDSMLRADILDEISQDAKNIKPQQQRLRRELSSLETRALKLRESGQVDYRLDARIQQLTYDVQNLKTLIEQLREHSFSADFITQLFPQQIYTSEDDRRETEYFDWQTSAENDLTIAAVWQFFVDASAVALCYIAGLLCLCFVMSACADSESCSDDAPRRGFSA